MTKLHTPLALALSWALALAGCSPGSTGEPAAAPPPYAQAAPDASAEDDAGGPDQAEPDSPATPGSYSDPLEWRGFIEHGKGHGYTDILPLEDGRVLYCVGQTGLVITDAADPSALVNEAVVVTEAFAGNSAKCQHIAAIGDFAYFAHRGDSTQPTSWVAAADLTATPPREVAAVAEEGLSFEGLAIVGPLLYAATHEDGLAILEHDAAAGSLTIVAQVGGFENAWGLLAAPDRLYATDGGGALRILDTSDPLAPQLLGEAALEGSPSEIALSADGATAYVACASAGLAVVDVSDAQAPVLLAMVETPGSATDVAALGDVVAVADWNDLRVFDVSQPAAPELIGAERVDAGGTLTRVLSIALRGDTLFAGEWWGLYTYEVVAERRAPELFTSTTDVDFGAVAAGASSSVAVIVENEGREPLVVTDISTNDPSVTIETASLALQPGDKEVVEVTLTSADGEAFAAELTLRSDDPDEDPLTITLTANEPGLSVGEAAPLVAVSLLDGTMFNLEEAHGQVVLLSYFATF